MNIEFEQRVNIEFCVKVGKTATETLQLLRYAYGDKALSQEQVFEWHSRFVSVEDDTRSGRPSSSRNEDNVVRDRDMNSITLKTEVVSRNEADSESLYGPVESVFIKEEVLEDVRTEEEVVDTEKNEMVCKEEAESVAPHSTDEPVSKPDIRERWWQCQDTQREQSAVNLRNGGTEPKSVHRTVESVYIKEEIVQSDPDDDDDDDEYNERTVKMETVSDEDANCANSDGTEHVMAYKIKEKWQHCPNTWRQQHTSDSQGTETSVSSEAVSASDHGVLESVFIKEEDISSESNDEDSSDPTTHVKKPRRKRRHPENHQLPHL